MRDFTKYDVWNNAISLSVKIYSLTANYPGEEKYGLVSQLRRASVSVPSNFAEGCSRSSEKDFKRFIEIAIGSAFELKTQLVISNKLGHLSERDFSSVIDDLDIIAKQLNSFRNKLN
ncbi:four helix bundle protein [Marinoscillum sp. 108]|uniref:Four helix bundle protein n=1 Tax=Marinoscillum luteum TaxID=861051 RepID=A0ABW7NC47_9BACT|nr:four helix bundle protein [Marinoscillum sp. 108]VXD19077.1 Four helix bundle protein [Marinoscillum sp. 108]